MINGNPAEVMQGVENNDLNQMIIQNPMDYIMPSPVQEFDITGMVSDSLKHFYACHETSGYKSCTCSSCRQLAYPILIKRTRDPLEYEAIHKSYLKMVQE